MGFFAVRKEARFAAERAAMLFSIVAGFLLGSDIASSILNTIGWLLLALGGFIHHLSHKAHPKAHRDVEEIDYVAGHGVYSWVRHPGYLGLMLMFFGLAVAFGSVPALLVAAILCIYYYRLVFREEELMLRKFGEAYARYMEEVPDRFIPVRKLARILRSRIQLTSLAAPHTLWHSIQAL